MVELTLIREFRAAGDTGADEARARARAALEAAIARSRPPRRRRRAALVAAATAVGAAAVAAAASAYGWGRLVDLVAGRPAPPPVKQAFALDNRARANVLPVFRSARGPRVIAAKARGVLRVHTSFGWVDVWVAPTVGGGRCTLLDIEALRRSNGRPVGAAECNPRPQRDPLEYGAGRSRVGNRYFTYIYGHAKPRVATVELGHADGTSEPVRLVDGYFLHELRGPGTLTVTARTRAGARVAGGMIQFGPFERIAHPVGRPRTLIRLRTSDGHVLSLALASSSKPGDLCVIHRFRGSVGTGCGTDPRKQTVVGQLAISPGLWDEGRDRKPLLWLDGVVGEAVASVEIQYRDGSVDRLPLVERFVLYEIPPAHRHDRSFTLIGRNAAGEAFAPLRIP